MSERYAIMHCVYSSLVGAGAEVVGIGLTEIVRGVPQQLYYDFLLRPAGQVYHAALAPYSLNPHSFEGAPTMADLAPTLSAFIGKDPLFISAPSRGHLDGAVRQLKAAGVDVSRGGVKNGSLTLVQASNTSHQMLRAVADCRPGFLTASQIESDTRRFAAQLAVVEQLQPGVLDAIPRSNVETPTAKAQKEREGQISYPVAAVNLPQLNALRPLAKKRSPQEFLAHMRDNRVGLLASVIDGKLRGVRFLVSGLVVTDAGVGKTGIEKFQTDQKFLEIVQRLTTKTKDTMDADQCRFLEKRPRVDGYTMSSAVSALPAGYFSFEEGKALPDVGTWVSAEVRSAVAAYNAESDAGLPEDVEDVYSVLTYDELWAIAERAGISEEDAKTVKGMSAAERKPCLQWIARGASLEKLLSPEQEAYDAPAGPE